MQEAKLSFLVHMTCLLLEFLPGLLVALGVDLSIGLVVQLEEQT